MGAGVQAVKQKLTSGFGPIEIREIYDVNADSTLLAFEAYSEPVEFGDGLKGVAGQEGHREDDGSIGNIAGTPVS